MADIDPKADPRGARWESRFRVPVLAAAILALPAVALYLLAKDGPLAVAAVVLSWAVWLVFAAEAAVMIWVVRDRRAWIRSHVLALIVVAGSFPLLVEIAKGLLAARALNAGLAVRVLQALYLLKLAKLAKAAWVLHQRMPRGRRIAVTTFGIGALPVGGLVVERVFI